MAKSKNNTLILGLMILGGLWYFSTKSMSPKSTDEKRQRLDAALKAAGDDTDVLYKMTADEIDVVYTAIIEYIQKGKKIDPNSNLRKRLDEIGLKYNIFT